MKGTLQSYDPATRQLIGTVECATPEEVRTAVDKSIQVQKEWGRRTAAERIEFIGKAAEKTGGRSRIIGRLLAREAGKSLRRGIGEVQSCSYARFTAEAVTEALRPQELYSHGIRTTIQHVPLGVCAVISPWNYPVSMSHWMLIPALAAGNTVILKPSEETPLVAQAYVDAMNEILPEGVLQIVQGDEEQGRLLTEDPGVALIAFTGSKETGKAIMRSAAGTLKRLIMELGGNDPLIVLADADLDAAAQFAVTNSLENSGQMCVATERIFVDRAVSKPFLKKVVDYAALYNTGPWDDPRAEIGPIINEAQRRRILEQIDDAMKKNATLLLGGRNHPPHYVLPTVLAGVTKEMRIAREETFGPVICVSEYEDIEEAISAANDTEYGLGAVVFGGRDAEQVASRLQAGMIGINTGVGGVGDTPWVGAKQSGFGFHGSPDGHRQFAQTRIITYGAPGE